MLEGMPGGRQTILFYLKLLLESVETDGRLRVNEKVAHTPETLARITHTEPKTAKKALEQLKQFGLLEIAEDQTVLLPGMEEMVGSESESAVRMRRKRDNEGVTLCESVTQMCENVTQSKSIEKEIEIELEKQSEQELKEEEMSTGEVFFGQAHQATAAPQELRVQLTPSQHRLLRERMGIERLVRYLEKMDQFTEEKQQRIKDPYGTILKWYEEDE